MDIRLHDSVFNIAELGGVPQLDLHGCPQDVALFRVKDFLRDHAKMGTEAVSIMHGKGTDTLQKMLRRELPKIPSVLAFRPSFVPSEMGAAFTVLLKILPKQA